MVFVSLENKNNHQKAVVELTGTKDHDVDGWANILSNDLKIKIEIENKEVFSRTASLGSEPMGLADKIKRAKLSEKPYNKLYTMAAAAALPEVEKAEKQISDERAALKNTQDKETKKKESINQKYVADFLDNKQR